MEEIIFEQKKDSKDIPKDRVICPLCWENNQTSKIWLDGGRKTHHGFKSYYDEEGIYHSHNVNIGRGNWHCSNKHCGEYFEYTKCPNCNYGDVAIKLVAEGFSQAKTPQTPTELKKDTSTFLNKNVTGVSEQIIFPPNMNSVSKAWNIY